MWEYKRIKRNGQNPEDIFKILNKLGAEGWEVIQYVEEGVTFSSYKDSSYLIVLKKLVNVTEKD